MPVYGTQASRFNDDGVTVLYQALASKLAEHGLALQAGKLPHVAVKASTSKQAIVPPQRVRYLAEIAETVRGYKQHAADQARIARERQQLAAAKAMLAKECKDENAALAGGVGLWPDLPLTLRCAPARDSRLPRLTGERQHPALRNENVFAVLVDAVRVCSLGQITHALFEVGGQYRRSM
jgi:hypothetical protein